MVAIGIAEGLKELRHKLIFQVNHFSDEFSLDFFAVY